MITRRCRLWWAIASRVDPPRPFIMHHQKPPKPTPPTPTEKNRLAISELKTSQDFCGSLAKKAEDENSSREEATAAAVAVATRGHDADIAKLQGDRIKALKANDLPTADKIRRNIEAQAPVRELIVKRVKASLLPPPKASPPPEFTPIFDRDAEVGALGAMMKIPSFAQSCTSLTAAHFSEENAAIFLAIADLCHRGAPISGVDVVNLLAKRGTQLNDSGGRDHIYRIEDGGTVNVGSANYHLAELHRAFRGRRGREIAKEFSKAIDSGEDIAAALATLNAAQVALERFGNTGIGKMLAERRYDSKKPPTRLPATYSLGGVAIATSGNLTAITGQAKSGKSSLLAAMIAAAHNPTGDTLGMTSNNDRGGALIHFDTEQAPEDHFDLIGQALRRAVRPDVLPWFRSYCLTDLSPPELLAALKFATAAAFDECGFIHSIIVDGIADLIHDVNDTIASPALILELRTLSIKYACPVVCVLHENPSKEGGQNKTRGHLGSQLERKAFASLTLSKNTDGVVSVFSGNSRKLHIAREGAPSFVWNNDVGMHITCDSPTPSPSAKRETRKEHLTTLLDGIYGDRLDNITLSFRHQKLVTELMDRANKSEATAKNMIKDMLDFQLIKKGEGKGEEGRYSRC